MTRILVQRGSSGSSSNQARSSVVPPQVTPVVKEEQEDEVQETGGLDDHFEPSGSLDDKSVKKDESFAESHQVVTNEMVREDGKEKISDEDVVEKEMDGLRIREKVDLDEYDSFTTGSSQVTANSSLPPPPPVPPPKPSAGNLSSRRTVSGGSNSARVGSSRRESAWPLGSTRTVQSDSRPSSPRSFGDGEGYNSADEQSPTFGSNYNDALVARVERAQAQFFEAPSVQGIVPLVPVIHEVVLLSPMMVSLRWRGLSEKDEAGLKGFTLTMSKLSPREEQMVVPSHSEDSKGRKHDQ